MKRPPFSIFPELSNEKIRLIELTTDYAGPAFDLLTYDGRKAKTLLDAKLMIYQINDDYLKGDSVNWLIIDNQTQKVAGTCGYNRGFSNDEGEIGYILLDNFKGKGYMSSTLKLVIEFGIVEMHLKKIFAHTKESNKESRILLERNSFLLEKKLRDDYVEYIYMQE